MTDTPRDPASDLTGSATEGPPKNATIPSRRGSVPGPAVERRTAVHKRTVGWRSRDVVRAVGLVAGIYVALKLIWFAHTLFLVAFLGVLFSIAVSSGVDLLQRWRVPRGIGAVLIVASFFGLLIGAGSWVAPTLRVQGAELKEKLPEAVHRVEQWIESRDGGVLGAILPAGSKAAPTPPAAPPARTPAAGATQTPSVAVAPEPESRVSVLRARLGEKMSGASRYLFPFLTSTVEVVAGLLLIIFLSIYFAADPDLYRRGALVLLPARMRERGSLVLDRIAIVLRKWLVTQLIAMVVIGTVTTVALLILNVKAAFALGLLAGLFEFIPTVGPLLSAVPGIGMAFLDSPEKALYVGIVYWGIQFLENNILIPLLMKGGMDLPPALTVLAQALLAIVFGFLGLMVAVPLLATVMVMIQVLYVEQLPQEGTWTYPVQRLDAEEPAPAGS